jgi:hypothetical protein
MIKNELVIKMFINGMSSENKNMKTDGENLYSYNLKIGYTENGCKYVKDYTRTGGHFVSATTSRHIGIAKRLGAKTVSVK